MWLNLAAPFRAISDRNVRFGYFAALKSKCYLLPLDHCAGQKAVNYIQYLRMEDHL
jgi:hypothetical protein